MVWRKMMNNTHRENGTMAGPLIFTIPAYGFVMALYLDWLGRTPTRERFPLTCVERTRSANQVSGGRRIDRTLKPIHRLFWSSGRFIRGIRLHYSCLGPQRKSPGRLG